MENGLNACARGHKRLKSQPILIYSCHSFGCLYKLTNHIKNLHLCLPNDIKTFESYIKLSGLRPSSFICLLMFCYHGQTLPCVFDM